MVEDLIGRAKMLRMLALINMLVRKKSTTDQLATALNVGRRTVYRYLKVLECIEISVDKDFRDRYFIAQDNCPFCKTIIPKEVHHHEKN
jgi:predicted DNA-binding transcriptional regulator YafY